MKTSKVGLYTVSTFPMNGLYRTRVSFSSLPHAKRNEADTRSLTQASENHSACVAFLRKLTK